ncbi:chemotaxis protein CheX [bacterium]|nr:chemotaxis protein CheX [bacterium]
MKLTDEQMDCLKKLVNIGVGRAASILSSMIQSKIRLDVPLLRIISLEEFQEMNQETGNDALSMVKLSFKGPFSGNAVLYFPTDSASTLVSLVIGEEPSAEELDFVRSATLTEVGNIVMNGVMGSIGNLVQQNLEYTVPTYLEDSILNLLHSAQPTSEAMILIAEMRFSVESLQIDGNIMLFFEVGSFDALVASVDAWLGQHSGNQ